MTKIQLAENPKRSPYRISAKDQNSFMFRIRRRESDRALWHTTKWIQLFLLVQVQGPTIHSN